MRLLLDRRREAIHLFRNWLTRIFEYTDQFSGVCLVFIGKEGEGLPGFPTTACTSNAMNIIFYCCMLVANHWHSLRGNV